MAIVSEPGNPIPMLGLDLRGSLPLKLIGTFVLQGGTGVRFSGLPDIPISNFELKFRENTLSTASVNLCKPPTPTFSTDFTAYSGARQSGITPATIEGCVPPRPPGVKVKVKGKGRKAKLNLQVTAGSSKLREVTLKLPKSLRFASGQGFNKGAKVNAVGGNVVHHQRSPPAQADAAGRRRQGHGEGRQREPDPEGQGEAALPDLGAGRRCRHATRSRCPRRARRRSEEEVGLG